MTTAGGVKCWGDNEFGQLGDGTLDFHPTPHDVTGLTSGVARISAGYFHVSALMTTGAAECWGYNQNGEVGDGTTTDRWTPVGVSGLGSGVSAVVAGADSCALTTSGAAKCWGDNILGQVGDGTTTDRLTPVGVAGLGSGVAAIAPGGLSAITTAGAAKCWAYEPGDGTTDQLSPVGVTGLSSGVAVLEGGSPRCAFTTAGALKCWGYNGTGAVGNGTAGGYVLAPVDVSGSFFRSECPTLVASAHTSFVMSDGYAVASVATFIADPGYVLVGSATLSCQGDHTWSADVPTASAQCPALVASPHTSFTLSNGLLIGSVATFSADAGYVLVGSASVTCQLGGVWSGSVPTATPCRRPRCCRVSGRWSRATAAPRRCRCP